MRLPGLTFSGREMTTDIYDLNLKLLISAEQERSIITLMHSTFQSILHTNINIWSWLEELFFPPRERLHCWSETRRILLSCPECWRWHGGIHQKKGVERSAAKIKWYVSAHRSLSSGGISKKNPLIAQGLTFTYTVLGRHPYPEWPTTVQFYGQGPHSSGQEWQPGSPGPQTYDFLISKAMS